LWRSELITGGDRFYSRLGRRKTQAGQCFDEETFVPARMPTFLSRYRWLGSFTFLCFAMSLADSRKRNVSDFYG
jgi:hypothetical protein